MGKWPEKFGELRPSCPPSRGELLLYDMDEVRRAFPDLKGRLVVGDGVGSAGEPLNDESGNAQESPDVTRARSSVRKDDELPSAGAEVGESLEYGEAPPDIDNLRSRGAWLRALPGVRGVDEAELRGELEKVDNERRLRCRGVVGGGEGTAVASMSSNLLRLHSSVCHVSMPVFQ